VPSIHLFRFKRGGLGGPNAFVGVDDRGQTFTLNLDNSLVPWGHEGRADPREERFFVLRSTAAD
jgi:hypothetical protein